MKSHVKLAEMAERGCAGRLWYARAHRTILTMANVNGVPVGRVADVVALFSPRVSVLRNLRMADTYLRFNRFEPDVTRTVRAAVTHYEETGQIRGMKTANFAQALLLNQRAVVLDVWVARAMRVSQRIFGTLSGYAEGEARVFRTAALLGWTPAETQACIWTAAVLDHGRRPSPFTF